LIAGALAAVLAFDASAERRWLYLAGLLCGLALGNHHLIALTFVIPAAVIVFARRGGSRPGARVAGITAMLGIVGLSVFLYLPVRSATHPEVNWGAPHTAERFAWTVSAKAFQKTAGAEHVSSPSEDAVAVTVALVDNVTPILALALLLALYLAVRRRDDMRRVALFLFGVGAVAAGARVLVGFDAETPDHYGYLLPAVMALIVVATAALGTVASAVGEANPASRRNVGIAMAVVVVLLAPYQLVRFGEVSSLREADASDALARWELEELPPRSLVVLAYFQTSFRVWALRAVEQARPDIQVLDRSFMTYPGMDAEARLRYPDLAALIDAPLRVGDPTPVDMLREIARTRPVFMQLHPNLDRTAEPWLLPAGPFAYFSPMPPVDKQRLQLEQVDARARVALDRRLGELAEGDRVGARDAALWHDFVRLSHYCATGRLAAAQAAFGYAWQTAPGDTMLADMAGRGGISVPR
jgi:4-amino-4-deoxy-L-arabinose transferase-like glycosyltransferase